MKKFDTRHNRITSSTRVSKRDHNVHKMGVYRTGPTQWVNFWEGGELKRYCKITGISISINQRDWYMHYCDAEINANCEKFHGDNHF